MGGNDLHRTEDVCCARDRDDPRCLAYFEQREEFGVAVLRALDLLEWV